MSGIANYSNSNSGYVALSAQEDPQLRDEVLQGVDAAEGFGRCLLDDVVLEQVDHVIELFEDGEVRIDESVDGEVRDERRFAVHQVGALVDSLLQVLQLR